MLGTFMRRMDGCGGGRVEQLGGRKPTDQPDAVEEDRK